MKKRVDGFNERMAVVGTQAFSSAWTVYAFIALGSIPLIPAFASLAPTILLISSCLIQLASLPLIAVGNKILSRASEQRAAQDHQQIMELHAEIRQRQEEAQRMRAEAKAQRDEADAKRLAMDAKLDELRYRIDLATATLDCVRAEWRDTHGYVVEALSKCDYIAKRCGAPYVWQHEPDEESSDE